MQEQIKTAIQRIILWVIVSSADPREPALTAKAALVAIVPAIMAAASLAHVSIGNDELTNIIDGIVMFIQGLLTVVAAAMAIWGVVRKIYYTIVTPAQA